MPRKKSHWRVNPEKTVPQHKWTVWRPDYPCKTPLRLSIFNEKEKRLLLKLDENPEDYNLWDFRDIEMLVDKHALYQRRGTEGYLLTSCAIDTVKQIIEDLERLR